MRSFRRVTLRVAPALASLASVLLFATCDFDKISGTPAPLSQSDIDRLFSITPADTTVILGGTTTLGITPGANIDLTGTTQVWTSSAPTVISIIEATGVATGVAIGNAVITARLLAPELDSGYSKTRALRVRYKGIKACGVAPQCSPSSLDSIAGLNLSRPVTFFGTNNTDVRQTTALTGVTISTHDSGSTASTFTAISGSTVAARRNGVAYVVGVFESMRDSIKVKVRQVAKSLTFPTTDYTANSLNANRTLPIIMRDVADSVMTTSPRLRWSSSDTSVVTIDSITGVLRVKKVDTARIFVRVDTILNKSQKLRVDQALASLTKFAGDITSDTVARFVTILPTVTAVDSGNAAIVGDTVTFRVGTGGGLITDSVKITDVNGRATVGSWQLGNAATAQTLIASSGNRSATFTVTGLPQRAFKLAFGVQPRSTATAASVAPAVTVTIRDSLNNLVTTASDSVFVAIGNNPGTATLSGTLRAAAVNGVATFANLALNAAASGYTLAATGAGALLSTISDAFDVFGAAAKLAVVRQPVGTSAGAVLDTIQIAVQDAAGNRVATDTRNVTLGIGTNPGGGGLSGTVTVAAVGGIATFTGLSINAAGVGYTLNATATGVTSAATNPFTIAAVGAANRLAFTTQPSNVASGATPNLAVTIQDANGATVTSSTAPVTLTLVAGSAVGVLTGTTTRNAVNGVATFPGISIDKVGTGYKFSAASSGLASAESNAFNVTPGTAAKLGFIAHPTHTVISTTMSPSVSVAIQDAAGNTVTSQGPTSITLAVAAGSCTGGGTISGGTTINSTNGVAIFPGITVGATQASNCALLATATGLTNATSNNFNMVAATGAIRLVFGTQPSTATAGNSIPTFTVRVVDASGATVTSAAPGVTLSVLSGPTTTMFGTTGTTASAGIATFSLAQLRTAGTYKLLATSTGFKADSSVAFTVNPGAVNRVGFVTQPASITAGSPFPAVISASYQDSFGNTVSSQNGTIEIAVQSGAVGAQVVGTRVVTALNGIAEFPGVTINKAFNGYTLFVSSAGFSGSVSNSFNVTAGPVSTLTFTTSPSSMSAGSNFSAVVQATDAAGNPITTFTSPITIGVSGGDGTASVIGTTTVTPTNGAASYTGLQIQKAGTNYKLTASASGLATAESNSLNVTAGVASKLGWIDQPQNTFQNAPLNPSGQLPRVAAQDQYGNTASHFSTIRITLVAPGGVTMLKDGFTQTFADYSPSGGIVTLNGLTLTGTGSNLQLTASSPFAGLTSANSTTFNLSAFSTKSKLGFKVQPGNGTLAVALSPAVEVAIQDTYGNTVTNATDQVTLAKGIDPNANTVLSGGTATAAAAGVATFSNLSLDKEGSGYAVQATATGLTSVTSSGFTITSPGHIGTSNSMSDLTRIGNTLYWIDDVDLGNIKSTSITGGPVTTLANSTTGKARRLTTDGTNLYWVEEGSGSGTGSVRRYNVAAGTSTTLASSLSNIKVESNTFATDGLNVYFHSNNAANTGAGIRSVPANAAGPQTPTDLAIAAGNTFAVQYFTVSGGQIYFFDQASTTVRRMPTSGGAPTTLTPGIGATAQRFALGGTTLYVSTGQTIGTIANADTRSTTATPAVPVTGLAWVYDMVIEGNNLYVKNGNQLRRYDVTTFGTTAFFVQLADNGQQGYQSLLLDGTHLYYSNFSSGIGKVLK